MSVLLSTVRFRAAAVVPLAALLLVALPEAAWGQASALSGSFLMPLEDDAIRYPTITRNDPVGRLQTRLDHGDAQLEWREPNGYLLSVLANLGIRVSSQTLVFSKTSFQQNLISPSAPRALYFNDDVYIGWVKHGDVVEVSTVDPDKGGVFYTLDQRPVDKPKFIRHDECLQCHASPKTLGVPGHLVRSVFPDGEGFPQLNGGSFHTDHSSPLSERFGGWFITGTHGEARHMGNAIVIDKTKPDEIDREAGANVTSLGDRTDLSMYASVHSDLVAHMVLAHQVTMHNLITRVSYETRVAISQQEGINKALGRPLHEWSDSTRRRIHGTSEVLLKYMLFTEEAPLAGPVRGTSEFAREFAKMGPRDSKGRSLRDLDMDTRLFRYPMSYLVYTEAFDALPGPAKDYIYRRLGEVLDGKANDKAYASLREQDRRAIREILIDTKPELRARWTPSALHRQH
ncbi:MAG: hypothetical protein R2762_04885 [Bryobacteraceae bacterium]